MQVKKQTQFLSFLFINFWNYFCVIWMHSDYKCLIYSEFSSLFIISFRILFTAVNSSKVVCCSILKYSQFKQLLLLEPKFVRAVILLIKNVFYHWGKLTEQNAFPKREILLKIGNSWLAKWTFIAHCKCRFCSHNCDYIKVSLHSDLNSKKRDTNKE